MGLTRTWAVERNVRDSPCVYLVVPPGGCFPETRRIELGPGAVTIGRAEACEIRVDVPGVDDHHAKISEIALIAMGSDCAVGDVPLDAGSRRLVMPGDEIQIGSVVIALEGDDPSLPPPPPGMLGRSRSQGALPEAPRIRVVEGSNFGDELLLLEEGREYLIGRGPSCDLVLEDREVSREHLKLMRQGYVVYIKDLSSMRGSWLGRSAVYAGSTLEWARPRMLRLGATVLSLDLPDAIRKAAPGAQASAPMTPPPRSRGGAGALSSRPPPAIPATNGSGPSLASSAALLAEEASKTTAPMRRAPAPSGAEVGGGGTALGSLPLPGESTRSLDDTPRKAWKKTGPRIGKASGVLLLMLAGLAVLGALFVVFSLLE